jgi:DnaJ-class molecular chaperone
MRADALIGVALTDDSKSTKIKDANPQVTTKENTRSAKSPPEAPKIYPPIFNYTLLDVSTDASQDEINKAYRKLSMLYHPERPPTRMPRRR